MRRGAPPNQAEAKNSLAVELYAFAPPPEGTPIVGHWYPMKQGETEVCICSVVVSHGEGYCQVSQNDRGEWEVEIVGPHSIHAT